MYFCPTCSNLLLIQGDSPQQLYCQTCPYIYPLVKTASIVQRKTLERKQVDDVMGGDDAWANVDQTEGRTIIMCTDKEMSAQYYGYSDYELWHVG
ncbi:DNA-directed RNA polymerase III subunit RPC10 [Mortierella sp. GBA43]|nr:DNA-directed RNA polymerase III subunit RPC10 [Mortierella sp. GBA43]